MAKTVTVQDSPSWVFSIKLFDAICLIQCWNNSAPWREGGLKSTSEPSQSSMVLGKGQWTCTEGTSDKDSHPEGVEAWDKSWDRLCSLFAWGYWKFSKALTGLALWPCLEQQGWARDLHAQLPYSWRHSMSLCCNLKVMRNGSTVSSVVSGCFLDTYSLLDSFSSVTKTWALIPVLSDLSKERKPGRMGL